MECPYCVDEAAGVYYLASDVAFFSSSVKISFFFSRSIRSLASFIIKTFWYVYDH